MAFKSICAFDEVAPNAFLINKAGSSVILGVTYQLVPVNKYKFRAYSYFNNCEVPAWFWTANSYFAAFKLVAENPA